MGGDVTAFFAVEAYDGVDCDALVVLEACVGFGDCWETWVVIGLIFEGGLVLVCRKSV
jgi:hypothetical protein